MSLNLYFQDIFRDMKIGLFIAKIFIAIHVYNSRIYVTFKDLSSSLKIVFELGLIAPSHNPKYLEGSSRMITNLQPLDRRASISGRDL